MDEERRMPRPRSARARSAALAVALAFLFVAWALLVWHPWIDWFGDPLR